MNRCFPFRAAPGEHARNRSPGKVFPGRLFACAAKMFLAVALFAARGNAGQAEAPPRLNVLLIMADDLNTDLGYLGHSQVSSPRLDQLAARGVVFTRAYCQYSVCNPSRTSMLSGLYPERTGVLDNQTHTRAVLGPQAVLLPQHFRQHGYRAVKLGKIFHTGPGFEDPASWDYAEDEPSEAKNPPAKQILSQHRFRAAGCGSMVLNCPDAEAYDGRLAQRAAAMLAELSAEEQPFFLAVGFRRPHQPYIAPRRYFELYSPRELLRPVDSDHLAGIPPLALTYRPGQRRLSPDEAAQLRAAYYASVSYLDAQVGQVLDAVERLNLWQETVVVFVSDHGYHLGEHGGLWHKYTLFEAATRVPMIVAAPGASHRVEDERLIELVDMYPTLADLCGLPPRGGLDGTSRAELLRGAPATDSNQAYTVVTRPGTKGQRPRLGRSLRTPRWRYTEWEEGREGLELYDYATDPGELRNRAGDPALAALESELRTALRQTISTRQP